MPLSTGVDNNEPAQVVSGLTISNGCVAAFGGLVPRLLNQQGLTYLALAAMQEPRISSATSKRVI